MTGTEDLAVLDAAGATLETTLLEKVLLVDKLLLVEVGRCRETDPLLDLLPTPEEVVKLEVCSSRTSS